ncbi:MAG: Tfp pilus assembly protein FimT/FimU [Candidatus Spyradosoma sp.]
MPEARRHKPAPRSRARAFTMMELLVVIALLGLVSAFVAVRFDALVPALESPSAETSARRAFALASHRARTLRRAFFVRLAADGGSLSVEDADGNAAEVFPLRRDGNAPALRLRADPRDGSTLFAPAGLREIDAAEFHPSGCATPTLVEILKNRKTEKLLQADPFSGALTERKTL